MLAHLFAISAAVLVPAALGNPFTRADTQLTQADVRLFPPIAFGHRPMHVAPRSSPRCKVFPGDPNWPSEREWASFNSSIDGALLKPLPPQAVCYSSSPVFNTTFCNAIAGGQVDPLFYLNDPVSVQSLWAQGNTCLITRNATGECTQGGYPTYVVDARTVKQVQAAVNFARNKNLRLVIK